MKVVLTKYFPPEFLALYFSDLSQIISLNFIEKKSVEGLDEPKSIESIKNKLKEADIICTTSASGTHFIKNLIENEALFKEILRSKKIFCVGKKSADLFVSSLEKEVDLYFPFAGSLADYINQNQLSLKKILHFCGSLSPKLLDAENYQRVVCYETHLSPHLLPEHSHVAFFSPSGVRSYFKTNRYFGQKFYAIGNTTAEELEKYLPQKSPIFIAENTTHTLLNLIHGDIYPTQ